MGFFSNPLKAISSFVSNPIRVVNNDINRAFGHRENYTPQVTNVSPPPPIVQVHDEFSDIIESLKQKITSLESQISQSKKPNIEFKLILKNYQTALAELTKDLQYIENQIAILDQMRTTETAIYGRLQQLSQYKDQELASKISEFEQLINENVHSEFYDYMVLFTIRQYLINLDKDTLNDLLPKLDLINIRDINFQDEYGKTILFYAIHSGDQELVKRLIDSGADVNHKSVFGYTPLHTAALHSAREIVKLLLQSGADSAIQSTDYKTPAMHLASLGQIDLLLELYNAGLKLDLVNHEGNNITHIIFDPQSPDNFYSEIRCNQICFSIDDNQSKKLQKLFNAISQSIDLKEFNTPNYKGEYPIHKLCNIQNISFLQYIFQKDIYTDKHGQSIVNIQTNAGHTPSYYAAAFGNLYLLKLLLNNGADIITRNVSILHSAAIYNQIEIFKEFANRFPELVDQADNFNATPLYFAASKGHIEMVKEIIQFKPNCKLVLDNNDTILNAGIRSGNIEVIKFIASLPHCNIEHYDTQGATAIHLIAFSGNLLAMQALLPFVKNIDILTMDGQHTALYFAAQNGHLDIIKLLHNANANYSIPGPSNFNCLAIAIQQNHFEVVKFLSSFPDLVEQCNGAADRHAFYIACKAKNLEIAQFLLTNHDCDLNSTDSGGNNGLLWSLEINDINFISQVIPKIHNIDQADSFGRTALHWSCIYENYSAITKLLLDKGANHSMKDMNGNTSLHYAAAKNDLNIAKLLVQYNADVNACNNNGQKFYQCAPIEMQSDFQNISMINAMNDLHIDVNYVVGSNVEDHNYASLSGETHDVV